MRRWYPLVLFVFMVAASAWAYPRLPPRVPIHWNVHGQPNGYGSRVVATVCIPLLLLGVWGLLRGLPRIDPRRASYARMQGTYDLVVSTWVRTHRFGGYVFAGAGVLMCCCVALPTALPAVVALTVAAVVAVVVYSFVAWRQETSSR